MNKLTYDFNGREITFCSCCGYPVHIETENATYDKECLCGNAEIEPGIIDNLANLNAKTDSRCDFWNLDDLPVKSRDMAKMISNSITGMWTKWYDRDKINFVLINEPDLIIQQTIRKCLVWVAKQGMTVKSLTTSDIMLNDCESLVQNFISAEMAPQLLIVKDLELNVLNIEKTVLLADLITQRYQHGKATLIINETDGLAGEIMGCMSDFKYKFKKPKDKSFIKVLTLILSNTNNLLYI